MRFKWKFYYMVNCMQTRMFYSDIWYFELIHLMTNKMLQWSNVFALRAWSFFFVEKLSFCFHWCVFNILPWDDLLNCIYKSIKNICNVLMCFCKSLRQQSKNKKCFGNVMPNCFCYAFYFRNCNIKYVFSKIILRKKFE